MRCVLGKDAKGDVTGVCADRIPMDRGNQHSERGSFVCIKQAFSC